MSLYQADQERAVRLMHWVKDWRKSQLISSEQHDRMAADLETGLRRTNVFLRATLFIFGLLIAFAATGLLAITIDVSDRTLWIIAAIAAMAALAAAWFLVSRYNLYRFGIEEAFAVVGIVFAGFAVGFFFDSVGFLRNDRDFAFGLVAASVTAFIVFFQFGFVYAAIIGMGCAALAPFPVLESDIANRSIAVTVLAAMFYAARLQRAEHGDEFPGDSYGIIETAAWAGIYFVVNLKISDWLSHPVESGPVYWITYGMIWMLPAAGLWIAVRERHRWLLDLNIVLAIVTMMSNKPYLNAESKPWDPITFGMLMIAIALGLRRWLESGAGGARNGFVAFRLLASERERLSLAGNVSVLQPSLHPQHAPEEPKPGFGGGRSGGAGTSAKF